jgi:hypothetical protein
VIEPVEITAANAQSRTRVIEPVEITHANAQSRTPVIELNPGDRAEPG